MAMEMEMVVRRLKRCLTVSYFILFGLFGLY